MPANLTSILGTDVIADSRSTINTNFQNLQEAKADVTSPSLLGVPTAPTAGVGSSTLQIANTAFVKTAIDAVQIPSIMNLLALPSDIKDINLTDSPTNQGLPSSSMGVYLVNVPQKIVAANVALQINSILGAGYNETAIVAYPETGTGSVLYAVIPSITSNGIKTASIQSSSVVLAAGNYYFGFYQRVSPSNSYFVWQSDVQGYIQQIGGKAIYYGIVSVVGHNIPNNISPSTLGAPTGTVSSPVLRLYK